MPPRTSHRSRRRSGKRTIEDTDVIIRKKMHAYLKMIRKAVKKAKLFEIRKIGRRLKVAQDDTSKGNSNTDIKKLESQLDAARNADVEALANKAASTLPDLPDGILQVPSSDIADNPAKEVVYRHILGAKCVVDQLATIASVVQTTVTKIDKIRKATMKTEAATEEGEDGDMDEDESEDSDDNSDDNSDTTTSEKEPDEFAQNALQKLLSKRSERVTEDSDDDSGLIEFDSYSDEDEDDSFDSLVENDDSDDSSDDGDDNSDDSDDSNKHNNKEQLKTKKDNSKKADTKAGKKNTDNKGNNKKKDAKQKKAKPKNRLGQRARRKLAEKMHGQQAKHLSTTENDTTHKRKRKDRDTGGDNDDAIHPSWAAKKQQKAKLSIDSNGTAKKSRKISFDDSKEKDRKHSHHQRDNTKEDASSLHPSWAIKKQQQEKQHIVPSQGKKVVFDDDD